MKNTLYHKYILNIVAFPSKSVYLSYFLCKWIFSFFKISQYSKSCWLFLLCKHALIKHLLSVHFSFVLLSVHFSFVVVITSGGLRVWGARGNVEKGSSDDAIILSQP